MNSVVTVPGIHAYDGYAGEAFWKEKSNESTYDDPVTDNQCKVSLRPISEIRAEIRDEFRRNQLKGCEES